MRKFGLGVAAALTLVAASPVFAQQGGYSANAFIFDFNEATLAPVLAQRKIAVNGRYSGLELSYIEVKFANGLTGVMNFTAKQPGLERRIGMVSMMVFAPRPDWKIERQLEMIVNFNRQNLLTQVGIQEDGKIYIMRYSTCDFGIAQGNVAAELQMLELVGKRLQDELAKP